MFKQLIKKRHAISRLERSCYKGLFENYSALLISKGYTTNTSQIYLNNVEHFTNWLGSVKTKNPQINAKIAYAFIDKHLPVCSCSPPKPCILRTARAALRLLLQMMGINKTSNTISANPHIDTIIKKYDNYLDEVCGLAKATRFYHRRYASEFLNIEFKSKKINFKYLTPTIIASHINKVNKDYKKSSLSVLINSLRRFFKFLQFSGDIDLTLIAALPRIHKWKLSTIPTCLQKAEIDKIISVFDRKTAIGKRDYAIARCLIDLGLRCSEVASLQLENIDWRLGALHLPKGKTHQEDVLPLTTLLTKALIDYLQHGRPTTNRRSVFVYHQAPFGYGIVTDTVHGVMKRAYKKAGLNITGTHILRRTLATKLLNNGSSLKDIADILRHRCIDTTTIYTKIDLPNLTQVSLPWPMEVL
jgi:site-specific recombinase XerD